MVDRVPARALSAESVRDRPSRRRPVRRCMPDRSPSNRRQPREILKHLYVQVLIGLVLGITVAHYWPEFGAALKPLGDGFVKLVKMMIAPIVFCTIVSGITSLGDSKEIGKTLLKSMGLFYVLTILALVTGLVAVLLLQPGVGMHIDPAHLDASVAASFANKRRRRASPSSCCTSFRNSFFGAFAEGEVLPVLLLAVLCGFGLTRIGTAAQPVLDGIDGFSHMLFAAFGLIMKLAPIGAFGAMAFTVGRYGIKSIGSLGLLIGTFYVACTLLRRRGAGHARPAARLQAVAADALHPRGAAGRARHVVERAGAAAPAAEAGSAWAARRAWSAWCCRPATRSTSTAPRST